MNFKDKYISVVIPAAGMGKRMESSINKQFLLINDKPILAHTIEKFCNEEYIDEIILVAREDEVKTCRELIIDKYGYKKVNKVIAGGNERRDSVYNGLREVNKNCDIVIVHDGARPFVSSESIVNSIEGAIRDKACVVGVPVKDTIKIIDENYNIIDTPKRDRLWAVQTPQTFSYKLLVEAYEQSIKEGYEATDDSMIVEKMGYKVKMIMGGYDNIKITTPEDLKLGEVIYKQ